MYFIILASYFTLNFIQLFFNICYCSFLLPLGEIVFGPHLLCPTFFLSDDVSIGLSVKYDQVCVLLCVTCHSSVHERITLHKWNRWIIQCMKARWVTSASSTFSFWSFHFGWNQTATSRCSKVALAAMVSGVRPRSPTYVYSLRSIIAYHLWFNSRRDENVKRYLCWVIL